MRLSLLASECKSERFKFWPTLDSKTASTPLAHFVDKSIVDLLGILELVYFAVPQKLRKILILVSTTVWAVSS